MFHIWCRSKKSVDNYTARFHLIYICSKLFGIIHDIVLLCFFPSHLAVAFLNFDQYTCLPQLTAWPVALFIHFPLYVQCCLSLFTWPVRRFSAIIAMACVCTMASVQPRMTAACFCNCQCTWLMMATVSCYMHHDGHLTAQVIAWHFVHFEMCLPLNLRTCYHGERRRTIRERGDAKLLVLWDKAKGQQNGDRWMNGWMDGASDSL